jgi:hypothetical protein
MKIDECPIYLTKDIKDTFEAKIISLAGNPEGAEEFWTEHFNAIDTD